MSELMIFRVSEGIGNACAFRFPDGSLGIVDWGTQEQEPLDSLGLAAGVRVRFILATHAHADHTLGLPKLLNACLSQGVKVDRLIYPSAVMSSGARDYLGEARRIAYVHKIPMVAIQITPFTNAEADLRPLVLDVDDEEGWRIVVLSPSAELVSREEVAATNAGRATGNVTSVVALYETMTTKAGCGDILLPGDAEIRTLEFARKLVQADGRISLDCDLLLVPHHGSKRNFPSWLHDHIAGHVVISGTHNSPHHPAEAVLTAVTKSCHTIERGGDVFCTSYASCCRKSFAASSPYGENHNCFGNLLFKANGNGTSFVASSTDGERMRSIGHCRNLA